MINRIYYRLTCSGDKTQLRKIHKHRLRVDSSREVNNNAYGSPTTKRRFSRNVISKTITKTESGNPTINVLVIRTAKYSYSVWVFVTQCYINIVCPSATLIGNRRRGTSGKGSFNKHNATAIARVPFLMVRFVFVVKPTADMNKLTDFM